MLWPKGKLALYIKACHLFLIHSIFLPACFLLLFWSTLFYSHWSVPWLISLLRLFHTTKFFSILCQKIVDQQSATQETTSDYTAPSVPNPSTTFEANTHRYPVCIRKPVERYGFASNILSTAYQAFLASVHYHPEPVDINNFSQCMGCKLSKHTALSFSISNSVAEPRLN